MASGMRTNPLVYIMKEVRKLDVVTFEDITDPLAALAWLAIVEKIFEIGM